uniref:Uncharacterized protein n=1 Tax=Moniliophthora roreri TaxID=221103 RepID=A0A0W0FE09_MONRR
MLKGTAVSSFSNECANTDHARQDVHPNPSYLDHAFFTSAMTFYAEKHLRAILNGLFKLVTPTSFDPSAFNDRGHGLHLRRASENRGLVVLDFSQKETHEIGLYALARLSIRHIEDVIKDKGLEDTKHPQLLGDQYMSVKDTQMLVLAFFPDTTGVGLGRAYPEGIIYSLPLEATDRRG